MLQSRESIYGALARNWGEFLSDQARRLREQMRRGAGLEEASQELQLRLDQCRLALAFADAEDLLKVRAMVEDWPRERIEAEFAESPTVVSVPG